VPCTQRIDVTGVETIETHPKISNINFDFVNKISAPIVQQISTPEPRPKRQTSVDLQRYRYELADWTSELAQGLGDIATALTARITAFKLRPSMRGYQQAKTLAGDTWQTLQPDLLKHLRTMDNWSHAEAKVQIFLHEGSIDDAIAHS
jgi:hypothetical protein